MSPRKVRLVIDTVRGLPVLAAETRLKFLQKDAALPVLKLLQSAMANAEHNFHLHKEDLVIAKITADGGPVLKRSRARAFGRSAPIRKRTTHIEIVLASKPAAKKAPRKTSAKKPAANAKKPAAQDAEVAQS